MSRKRKSNTQTRIQFINYSSQGYSELETTNLTDIQSFKDGADVSWVRVFGITNSDLIVDLVKSAGLTELDAKDVLTTRHNMFIEEYDENIFVVMPVTYPVHGQNVTEQVALIVGKNYLISIQESDYPLFEEICSEIKSNQYQKFNHRKSDFLMASILNDVIRYYSDEVAQLEDDLEDLEDQLLDIKQKHSDLMGNIQAKRRQMIHLRKLLFPFKDQICKLLRVNPELINSQEIPYFKDIDDQLLYVLQNLEACREIMSSLMDLYLDNNDLKMNMVMKQLTLVATIFIPLTFLVGVWGMNFKFIPEQTLYYGYFYAWAFMLVTGLLVWWYLKRKDWM